VRETQRKTFFSFVSERKVTSAKPMVQNKRHKYLHEKKLLFTFAQNFEKTTIL
jgi:hypothetical protein